MSSSLTTDEARARARLHIQAGLSNEILNSEEEHILRGMLVDERRYLCRLDREIDRLESILAGLQQKREICVARMNRFSVALSPQKRLPSEIVAKIFMDSLGDKLTVLPLGTKDLPWVLLWVCSRWRQVALAEHRLWSHVDVKDSQLDSTGNILSNWIPQLWGLTKIFPVSLAMRSSDKSLVLHDTISPYFSRLQSLSLRISQKSLALFLLSRTISFDALESLVLDFTLGVPFRSFGLPPTEHPLVVAFTTSPMLREVTLKANSTSMSESIFLSTISQLPWSQLTRVTLVGIQLLPEDFCNVLGRCTRLVDLTLTPGICRENPTIPTAIIPPILLSDLRSITIIMGSSNSSHDPVTFLEVPSLKEFVVKNAQEPDDRSLGWWSQAQFTELLARSGCHLVSLDLSSYILHIDFESIFSHLPFLTSLVVSLNHIPGEIFDKMARGEILQKLEHLECFTTSPMSFFRLLEYQYKFMTSGEYRGLTSGDISYMEPKTRRERNELDEIYERLEPELKTGERNIELTEFEYPDR